MKSGPIILIDDDKDDVEIISECFKELGVENKILCFINGKEALEHLETSQEHAFVILCDINMPVMNGIQLRKIINSTEYLRRKSIPFIFFTTSATEDTVREAYDLTVQGFFEKPHNINEMQHLLKMIVVYWKSCNHPNNIIKSNF